MERVSVLDDKYSRIPRNRRRHHRPARIRAVKDRAPVQGGACRFVTAIGTGLGLVGSASAQVPLGRDAEHETTIPNAEAVGGFIFNTTTTLGPITHAAVQDDESSPNLNYLHFLWLLVPVIGLAWWCCCVRNADNTPSSVSVHSGDLPLHVSPEETPADTSKDSGDWDNDSISGWQFHRRNSVVPISSGDSVV